MIVQIEKKNLIKKKYVNNFFQNLTKLSKLIVMIRQSLKQVFEISPIIKTMIFNLYNKVQENRCKYVSKFLLNNSPYKRIRNVAGCSMRVIKCSFVNNKRLLNARLLITNGY